MSKRENDSELSDKINTNIEHYKKLFDVEHNYDIVYKILNIGEKRVCFFFIDGFTKDEVLQKIFEFVLGKKEEDIPEEPYDICREFLPYGETSLLKDDKSVIKNLLSGATIFLIEGFNVAYSIDCRQYPARDVSEPEKNKSLRGSRDGFVETIVFNTALLRRRIRDTSLKIEMLEVGSISKTDIAVCYMDNKVDKKLLDRVKSKINNIEIESLTMNQESLAECLFKRKWIDPFPKFKYSERPDATAASVLEGSIIVFVDNSPSAMILPAYLFDIIEEADDYYFPPITGTYLRLSRIIINIIAILLTPTWLLLIKNPDSIPAWLEFINVQDDINVPIILQLLILEFAIDGLRLAALNTPNMLSTPLSVIAALVIGDFAASSGWFNSETMLYMAFVALANYTQPNYEFGYALKFMRLILLIFTGLLNTIGYIIGIFIVILAMFSNKTLNDKNYAYPLFPLNVRELCRKFIRYDIKSVKNK